MEVRELVRTPLIICLPDQSVAEAVASMLEENRERLRAGAVLVMEGDRIAGIFSERDVIVRVVGAGLNPATTTLRDVMTANVVTMHQDVEVDRALGKMIECHFRHMPLIDDAGRPTGMISQRRLIQYRMEVLDQENTGLTAYMGADGPGG